MLRTMRREVQAMSVAHAHLEQTKRQGEGKNCPHTRAHTQTKNFCHHAKKETGSREKNSHNLYQGLLRQKKHHRLRSSSQPSQLLVTDVAPLQTMNQGATWLRLRCSARTRGPITIYNTNSVCLYACPGFVCQSSRLKQLTTREQGQERGWGERAS